MNDAVAVRVTETRADLFDISERFLERRLAVPDKLLQVTAGQVFENKIMKDRASQIPGRAVPDAADYVRVANAIERDRLVLKVLDKCSLEVVVEIVLKKDVQGLYDD